MHRIMFIIALWAGLAGVGCRGRAGAPPSRGQTGTETTTKMSGKTEKTDAEWRSLLTPEQYRVTCEGGTEPAFTGKYWNTKTPGVYRCVRCEAALFDSSAKYDSGTGWPSFYAAIAEGTIREAPDHSGGMNRTEILCARCGAHLGHVFNDGPAPTGLRYCTNSAALKLVERPK